MNWYIGQKIVAVSTPRAKKLDANNKVIETAKIKIEKGKTYLIKRLRQCSKCKVVFMDVGFTNRWNIQVCTKKCWVEFNPHGIDWFPEHYFAPLEELDNTEQLQQELIKEFDKPLPKVNEEIKK